MTVLLGLSLSLILIGLLLWGLSFLILAVGRLTKRIVSSIAVNVLGSFFLIGGGAFF
jgi:hypothetical protein